MSLSFKQLCKMSVKAAQRNRRRPSDANKLRADELGREVAQRMLAILNRIPRKVYGEVDNLVYRAHLLPGLGKRHEKIPIRYGKLEVKP